MCVCSARDKTNSDIERPGVRIVLLPPGVLQLMEKTGWNLGHCALLTILELLRSPIIKVAGFAIGPKGVHLRISSRHHFEGFEA